MHDTVEDTKATYETVKKEFGKEVADLVDMVLQKSLHLKKKAVENSKAENLRKINFSYIKRYKSFVSKISRQIT